MFLKMIVRQARHKWPVTLLLWVAMTVLVSLYVYLGNSAQFANPSVQITMKSMGHNLLLISKTANPLDAHLCTDRQVLFPVQVASDLGDGGHIFSLHY